MKRYFYLQIKRVLRVTPFVLAVTMALLIGLVSILGGAINHFSSTEENRRFKIAITGDIDDNYFEWGMAAMKTLDDTRFSIDFIESSEADAKKALYNGDISAYVIIPDNFIEKALHGEIDPIKYITTPGSSGIVTLFKNEVTQLVTDMVVYSQKGTYGIGDAMRDNGLKSQSSDAMNRISIQYADLIFHRSQVYTLEELGIENGLSMPQYFICGIMIMLLVLIGLPYVTVHIKKDRALDRLLISKGYSGLGQLSCEYAAHLLAMFLLVATVIGAIWAGMRLMPDIATDIMTAEQFMAFALRLIPVTVMLAVFNIMIFELSDNIVSGVLLHFFSTLALCYISGCLYPIYTFPQPVQKIAVFLPTGVARGYLSGCFTDSTHATQLIGLFVYTLLFFGAAFIARLYKTAGRKG